MSRSDADEYQELRAFGMSDHDIRMARNSGASHRAILAWAKKDQPQTAQRDRYEELRDAILEILPTNSPARHPETGVSVVDELSDMKRDFSNLVKLLRADRDEVVSESGRVMLALEMAERWLS